MATAIFEIGNVQIDKLTEPSGGESSTFGDTIIAPGIDAPASSVFNIGATNATAINLGHPGLTTYAYGSNFFVGSNLDLITAGVLSIGMVNATSIHVGSSFVNVDGYLVSAKTQGTAYFGGGAGPSDGSDVNTILKYQTAEGYGPAFYEWFSDFTNLAGDGHKDQAYAFGWNENSTGVIDPTRGAFGFHIENDYQPTLIKRQIEHYYTAYNPADGYTYRPFAITVDLLNAGPPQVGVAANSFGLQRDAGGTTYWSWSMGDGSGTCAVNSPSGNTAIITLNNNVPLWQGTLFAGGHAGLLNLDNTDRLIIGNYGIPSVYLNDIWFYDGGGSYPDSGTNAIFGFSGKLNIGTDNAPINSGFNHKLYGYRKNGENYGTGTDAAIILQNAQPSGAGAQQYSPVLEYRANGWNPTGGSGEDISWGIQNQPVQQVANSARGDLVYMYKAPGGSMTESFRYLGDSSEMRPANNNAMSLGDSTHQFKDGYFNSITNTSGDLLIGATSGSSTLTLRAPSGTINIGVTTTTTINIGNVAGPTNVTIFGDVNTKSHAGYTGSQLNVQTAAVQTTNNTMTTIYTLPLVSNTTYSLRAICVARDEAGVEHATIGRVGCFYREGGSATQQGTTSTWFSDIHSTPAIDLSYTTSGNNVLVQVAGLNATTIDWVVTIEYQAVSTTA